MLVLRDESMLGGGHIQRRARDQAAPPHMQWELGSEIGSEPTYKATLQPHNLGSRTGKAGSLHRRIAAGHVHDTSRCLVTPAAEVRRARQSLSIWAGGETEVGGSRLDEYLTHSGSPQRASSCCGCLYLSTAAQAKKEHSRNCWLNYPAAKDATQALLQWRNHSCYATKCWERFMLTQGHPTLRRYGGPTKSRSSKKNQPRVTG